MGKTRKQKSKKVYYYLEIIFTFAALIFAIQIMNNYKLKSSAVYYCSGGLFLSMAFADASRALNKGKADRLQFWFLIFAAGAYFCGSVIMLTVRPIILAMKIASALFYITLVAARVVSFIRKHRPIRIPLFVIAVLFYVPPRSPRWILWSIN